MLEKILLPLDGSRTAEAIFPQVYRILKRKDSEVVLLRVVEPGPAPPTPESYRREAGEYLRGVERRLREEGVQVRGLVEEGPAAQTILQAASREGAGLIALSTHGRTGYSRWVMGSVVEKVIRASPVPVLAVRSFGPEGAGQGLPSLVEGELSLRRILVPLDMSPLSLEVVPRVVELAQVFESEVVILHVMEERLTRTLPEMREAADLFHERGLKVEPVLEKGDPAARILDVCSEKKADLIAMTTHGRSGVSLWALGSVTDRVLRAARVPLLVARGASGAGRNAPW